MSTHLSYTIPYDPAFLGGGFEVPLPRLSPGLRSKALRDGEVFDYIHYSVVMQAERKTALFAACNLDGGRKVQIARKKLNAKWKRDARVGFENQVGDEGYGGEGAFDRGHLVRREDVQWGTYDEAFDAARSTFFYPNAAPQHHAFNQDEWLELEEYALDHAVKHDYRLCVFNGPVLDDSDPTFGMLPDEIRIRRWPSNETRIPRKFWKVIVLRDEAAGGDDLAVLSFLMDQSELWHSKDPAQVDLGVYQVALTEIEALTGLDFGALRNADELSHLRRERTLGGLVSEVRIRSAEDLVLPGEARRADRRLAADLRTRSPRSVALSGAIQTARSSCSCTTNVTDRLATLESSLTRLADALGVIAVPSDEPLESASPSDSWVSGGSGHSTLALDSAATGGPADPKPPSSELSPRWQDTIASIKGVEHGDVRERLRRLAEYVEPPLLKNLPTGTSGERRTRIAHEIAVRIVGGVPARWQNWPHCVVVGNEQEFYCTGVLVHPRFVLTAAHCAFDFAHQSSIAPTRVFIGDDIIPPAADEGMTLRVRRHHVHPSYLEHGKHDLCLIELGVEAPSIYRPISIATLEQLRASRDVQLVGFGNSDRAGHSGFGRMREVRAPLFAPAPGPHLTDVQTRLGFDAAYEFVSGHRGLDIDTCTGDSGGPAYVQHLDPHVGRQWFVAGLTSRATRDSKVACGDGGIYTMVAPHLGWLAECGLPVEKPSPLARTGELPTTSTTLPFGCPTESD